MTTSKVKIVAGHDSDQGDNPINSSVSAKGKPRIKWYRCKVPREELAKLNTRSDLKGFAQTLGFFSFLALSASLAVYSAYHWPWYVTLLLLFWNGMHFHFLGAAFHELVHDSVFRTKWLNRFFTRVVAFLGWTNQHHYWASHTEHHKYTLHPPDDLEVKLPKKIRLRHILLYNFINPLWPYYTLSSHISAALGRIPQDVWTQSLFPDSNVEGRRKLVRWERVLVIGHVTIVGVSIYMQWWMIPLVVTFPMAMGSVVAMLCSATQHMGLSDNTDDYRLCCRTVYLNPYLRLLYWHMNYHTEHHMYAAVPCYNLGKLHKLIKHDMPHCSNGLIEACKQLYMIQKRQEIEPHYQYVPTLPSPVRHPTTAAD